MVDLATVETVLLVLLVLDAVALATLILMQQGRGADVGATFGSGGANTMFGSGGASTFMTRLIVWLAIGFFVITFGLAYTAKERAGSVGREGLPTVPVEETVVNEAADDVPELTTGPEGGESDLPDI